MPAADGAGQQDRTKAIAREKPWNVGALASALEVAPGLDLAQGRFDHLG